MRIKWHIAFKCEDLPHLARYIDEQNIPADISYGHYSFDIYEDSKQWNYIYKEIRQHGLPCMAETHFDNAELLAADWLHMRSGWHFGYPQPESAFDYETITYTRSRYCTQCGTGLQQIDSFRLKNVPNWGSRHFGELNWVGDELFVDDIAKHHLSNANITGITFEGVKDKKGQTTLSNIHQIRIPYVLPAGLDEEHSCIRNTNICLACNTKKYITNGVGQLVLNKFVFENAPMVVKTAELFGDGKYAARKIIVHQEVYRTIIANKLDRGLVFEPIALK